MDYNLVLAILINPCDCRKAAYDKRNNILHKDRDKRNYSSESDC